MSNHHDPGHADKTPDVSDIANPDVSHEGSDVNVGTVFKFIGVLFVSTLVIMVVVRWMAGYLLQREISEEVAPASRVNPPGTQRLPPMPRLQGAPGSVRLPEDDLKKFREEQETAVDSYGWVDRQAGVVRIPIEEAKRLILERGMPVVSATPVAAKSPVPAASTSNAKPGPNQRTGAPVKR